MNTEYLQIIGKAGAGILSINILEIIPLDLNDIQEIIKIAVQIGIGIVAIVKIIKQKKKS